LGELHYQYRVIPEWKLNAEALKPLRLFIIPNAEVLDRADVVNVIEPWVKAGGLLIVTGDSGSLQGEGGNFDPTAGDLTLASLTGVATLNGVPAQKLTQVGAGKVLFLRDNIGMTYWNEEKQRAAQLPQFQAIIDQIMQGHEPMVLSAPGVPGTVGLVVYEDAKAGRLFIDANNYDYSYTILKKGKTPQKDRVKETITPTKPVTFTVKLPAYLQSVSEKGLEVEVMSPSGWFKGPKAKLKKIAPDRAEVTLSSFKLYACVVIEAKD
jgi:hypothetical protein